MYYHADPRPGKIPYYICASKWSKDKCSQPGLRAKQTDTEIWWSIMTYLTDERYIAQKVRDAMSTGEQDKISRQRLALERTIADLERQKTNIGTAIQKLGYRDDLGERLKGLDDELTTAKQEHRNLLEAKMEDTDPEALAQAIKAKFWKFSENPMKEQKRILSEIVSEITIGKDDHADFVVRIGFPMPSWKREHEGAHPQDFRAFRDYVGTKTATPVQTDTPRPGKPSSDSSPGGRGYS